MASIWNAVLAAAILAICIGQRVEAAGPVTVWSAPAAEKLSEDDALAVNGESVPVYSCRVSAVPLNQVWPGYQRPIDQTESASFAHWGMSGPVRVEVTATRAFKRVVVRPLARGIRPTVHGQQIVFTLEKPGQVTVEFDSPHHALHLFADPPEADLPQANAAKVRYFGPGVHRPGKIQLHSGETLYIAGGAVVYTAVSAHGATGVRILGRGIIDTSEYERGKGGGCIRVSDCSDVKIDGVILRDPDVWCLSAFGCRNLEISNVKLVGLWRYNADGIDICNCQDVVVGNSFVRSFDDAIVLKGLDAPNQQRPVRNVRVHGMVLWCDWGRALEIGAETAAPEIANIRFCDCDIIRTTHIAMDIQCGDRALVHDVRYENIRTETDDVCPSPRMQSSRDERYIANPNDEYVPDLLVIVIAKNAYSRDAERGNVRDITYTNISVTGRRTPRSYFSGLDAEHSVQRVAIHNLRLNGNAAASATEARLSIGPHVSDVSVDLAAHGGNARTTVEPRLGKIKAGRILFLGNSITACPPTWWGLSASAAAKDYAHLSAAAIDAKSGGRLTMIPTTAPTTSPDGSVDVGPSNVINIADVFERGYASYHAAKISKQIAWKADIVVLQFGENIPMATFNASVFKNSLKSLVADLKASSDPHIFMPSYILGANPTVDAIKRGVCAEDPTHRVFVDLSSVSKDSSNMGAYGHPGDKGMRLIADMLFKAILEHSAAPGSSHTLKADRTTGVPRYRTGERR
jgi:hypothetical protein